MEKKVRSEMLGCGEVSPLVRLLPSLSPKSEPELLIFALDFGESHRECVR